MSFFFLNWSSSLIHEINFTLKNLLNVKCYNLNKENVKLLNVSYPNYRISQFTIQRSEKLIHLKQLIYFTITNWYFVTTLYGLGDF